MNCSNLSKKARQKLCPTMLTSLPKLKTEDTASVRDCTAGPFDPVYVGDY